MEDCPVVSGDLRDPVSRRGTEGREKRLGWDTPSWFRGSEGVDKPDGVLSTRNVTEEGMGRWERVLW